MTAAPRPAPLHTDTIAFANRRNDGKIPAEWDDKAPTEEVAQANVIAALAWERIRDPHDPPFIACSRTHREKLVAEVEGILKSGPPIDGAATPFTDTAVQLIAEIRAYLDRPAPLMLDGEIAEGDNQ